MVVGRCRRCQKWCFCSLKIDDCYQNWELVWRISLLYFICFQWRNPTVHCLRPEASFEWAVGYFKAIELSVFSVVRWLVRTGDDILTLKLTLEAPRSGTSHPRPHPSHHAAPRSRHSSRTQPRPPGPEWRSRPGSHGSHWSGTSWSGPSHIGPSWVSCGLRNSWLSCWSRLDLRSLLRL